MIIYNFITYLGAFEPRDIRRQWCSDRRVQLRARSLAPPGVNTPISTGAHSSHPKGGVVARAVVSVPTLLCLWISEIIASLPGLSCPGQALQDFPQMVTAGSSNSPVDGIGDGLEMDQGS